MKRDLPIGIFDSGVGGLTVYRALHERLPRERFVYLGDTARVPYGTKSLRTVERYAIENARFLEAHGIKMLVVACNTASALALPAVGRSVSVPVVGVIEPGARAVVEASAGRRIGVIATESTVKSGAYSQAIRKLRAEAEVVERACPLFVSLAEEGWAETDVARAVAAEYLADLRGDHLDALVLGCTHYPILRGVIQETVGARVRLIDSGEATAASVEALLGSENLARTVSATLTDDNGTQSGDTQSHGARSDGAGAMSSLDAGSVEGAGGARARSLCDDLDHFYVTDAAERFARVAERFLGSAPRVLEAVEVWGQDEFQTRER
ncbi:MAG TPA: glutamate racemase [Pyrinomonadaceae bacterium]|nr:glutamate racemase [Pyrinomonadaceae bacterium]